MNVKPLYTTAPTNPCCSGFQVFDGIKLQQKPWGFTKTDEVYNNPEMRRNDPYPKHAPDTKGAGFENNYIDCPQYPYPPEMQPMPKGTGISDACNNPVPQVQWYKYGWATTQNWNKMKRTIKSS